MLDFRAETIHPQSAPPNAETKHLVSADSAVLIGRNTARPAKAQFSEITEPIKVYGLEDDPEASSICSMQHPVQHCSRTDMAAPCWP
jgi:hypothetical protein